MLKILRGYTWAKKTLETHSQIHFYFFNSKYSFLGKKTLPVWNRGSVKSKKRNQLLLERTSVQGFSHNDLDSESSLDIKGSLMLI